MNIVLTGSLGHIGKPLTETLARQGHTVSVVSSSQDRIKDIEAFGATAAIGSVDDAGFLGKTFVSADAVFLMTPPAFGEPDQIAYYGRVADAYIAAVSQAGVRRMVNLSSYGADLEKDTGFILGAHKTEEALNALPDARITHIRAGYFYHNLLSFKELLTAHGIIASNFGGEDRLPLVHPTDIAAAVAEELQADTPAGHHIRYVVSDDCSADDIARVLGTAVGKPDAKWLTFSDEQTAEAMAQRGLPLHLVSNFVALGARIHDGTLTEHYRANPPATLGTVKLEDFATEFAGAAAGQ